MPEVSKLKGLFKVNLLFFETNLNPNNGGVARVTNSLFDYFEKNGLNCYFAFYGVDWIQIPFDKKIRYDENMPYSEFKALMLDFIHKNRINIIINQELKFEILARFYREIRRDNDIYIINCNHNFPLIYKFLNRTWRSKVSDFLFRLRNGYDRYAEEHRLMYDVSDKYLLLSHSFVPDAIKHFGFKDKTKVEAISNPLPFVVDNITPFSQKKKRFLIVSRLEEYQKNLTSALRIWKMFETYNNEYELVIAGYGPNEQMYKDYAKELHLKNISFIGKTDNPVELYNESQFFMMTSRYEGFGMTLIEAQQCGCIPFAFDSYSALHDIITDGYNGFIISNNDEIGYCTSMLLAIENIQSMDNISKNAHVSSFKFSVDNIGKEWIKLFEHHFNKK